MMFGCTEDGEAEEDESDDDDDDDEETTRVCNAKVIDSSSSEDEDSKQVHSCEKEQQMFTKCEEVFIPLMDRLRDAAKPTAEEDTSDENSIIACINSMILNVDFLTPPFLREYPIIKLVLSTKEGNNREIKARCKHLRKEMKRVYNAKEKDVPSKFVAIKRGEVGNGSFKSKSINDDRATANDGDGNVDGAGEDGMNPTKCKDGEYSIGTAVVKQFGNVNRTGSIKSYDAESKSYRIMFSQGYSEELSEAEVSHLLLTSTAWFCIAAPTNGEENFYSLRVKAHRELVCMICKKKDNTSKNCLRIPVQCNVGDECEFEEFRKYHAKPRKSERSDEANGGCAEAMHVGCARWGSDYAKVNNKGLRLCYYFSGQPPTYSGEDAYQDPVSNCFCRIHAREIQEGMKREKKGGSELSNGMRVRSGVAGDDEDAMSQNLCEQQEVDDSRENAGLLHAANSRKKKRKRIILEDSDDGSD
jgi:hypothetical protein